MATGYKGLPLEDQETRTWNWYVGETLMGIGLIAFIAWLSWLFLGPDKIRFNVSFAWSSVAIAAGYVGFGFVETNDLLYIVPTYIGGTAQRQYWHVSAGGAVGHAVSGQVYKRAEIFCLEEGEIIELKSIVRQLPTGLVMESHKIKLILQGACQHTITQFLGWYEEYRDPTRLPPTDRFEKQLQREAERTDMMFRLTVLPKPVLYRAAY